MFDVYLVVPGRKDLVVVQDVPSGSSVEDVALSLGAVLVGGGHVATSASLVRIVAHEGFVLSSSHHEAVVAALRLLRTGSMHVMVRVIGRDADKKVVQYVGNAVSLLGREPLPRCLVRASKQLPKQFACLPEGLRLSLAIYPAAGARVSGDFGFQFARFTERLKPVLAHRCQGSA